MRAHRWKKKINSHSPRRTISHPWSNTLSILWLCIHPIWMWDAVNGGFQPQQWHHNIVQARPYPIFPKTHPHVYTYNSIRLHPYAHPQHLKVLKLFAYIQYGCEMQSMGVCSLNHDTTTSYMTPQHHTGSAILKFSWNSPPPAHVLQHKDTPICPSTASQGAKTLCIHPIWMWDAINGGWQPPVKVFPWYKSQYRVSH